jgi:UDP-2-acetamido-3-amino-2,3-dideoxy-glucuronate N-acetyltransferase
MKAPQVEPAIVHPTADVDPRARIGAGSRVWHRAHVREDSRIGTNCTVSKDVYIDVGVVIGDRVKIQNGVSVYQGVTVEDDVFLGPHMAFTNDETPRAFSIDWQVTPTMVRRGASIGANATIVCGAILGQYSMVGAGSVVTNDVPDYALVVGNPASIVGYVCECGTRLKIDHRKRHDREAKCESCGKQYRLETGAISII